MKLTSIINISCLLLGLLAIVGKALHIPGMAVVLIISLGISSILFFLEVLLGIFYFKGYGIVIVISSIACFGLSTLIIGVLFRFIFWPGWAPMLLIGSMPVMLALIFAILNQPAIKNMDTEKRTVLIRSFIVPAVLFLLLGFMGLFMPEYIFWNIFSIQAVR